MEHRCFLCDKSAVARVRAKGRWEYACRACVELIATSLFGQGEPILYCVKGKPIALAIPEAFHHN